MPCTSCMKQYSRLNKEYSCSRCKFGFCARCLSSKSIIPNVSSKPVPVCNSCLILLSSNLPSSAATSNKHTKNRTWGEDTLPPPSLRSYTDVLVRMPKAPESEESKWQDLKQRLKRLITESKEVLQQKTDESSKNKQGATSKASQISKMNNTGSSIRTN